MKRILFLTIFALIIVNAFTCNMIAAISDAGYNLAWRDSTFYVNDELYDLIEFCEK